MTLDRVKVGQSVVIDTFLTPESSAEAIRLGLVPGHRLTVVHKVSGGPVVVRTAVTEIAVGHTLARQIDVRPANP
ncbi:hypothetical protein TPY_3591 [Sulfobacillus acidophilus TPY]|uniref:FeoA family protein n=1 Tax=Sulfobacillus acidophilus (strain ATCC 700253 / DSM 10332 / NAL) TaxID=679936 RepID=G8TVY1_SULAD|nr:hypothetical protein TPY_3591 [Sulfobacillus acidophilus TPY]AEW04825.1 FeoA family protein [Sulfobacillus acidophilus DSM 10332]